jgi:hypothetical protein
MITVSLTACKTLGQSYQHDKPGPPPHAPAHGHRHKHKSGLELVFDSKLGAYVVIKYSKIYYSDGYYLRYSKGVWRISSNHDGPWKKAKKRDVPSGLKKKHKSKDKKKHKKGKKQYYD